MLSKNVFPWLAHLRHSSLTLHFSRNTNTGTWRQKSCVMWLPHCFAFIWVKCVDVKRQSQVLAQALDSALWGRRIGGVWESEAAWSKDLFKNKIKKKKVGEAFFKSLLVFPNKILDVNMVNLHTSEGSWWLARCHLEQCHHRPPPHERTATSEQRQRREKVSDTTDLGKQKGMRWEGE